MKIWIDDVRYPPDNGNGWIWHKTINPALRFIRENCHLIDTISLDHDAGDFRRGGKEDYIVILKELERLHRRGIINCSHIKFRLHSANPVGVANMRAIIQANGWKEIY